MQDKVLLIIGMGRSGTSFVTSWLNACGLDVGDDLVKTRHLNANGCFEDKAFQQINFEIFRYNGLPVRLDVPLEKQFHISEKIKRKARSLARQRAAQGGQWAFKDPSTTLFLDFWREVLPQANYLFIYRHYSAVVDSLLRLRERIQHHRRNFLLGKFNVLRYRLGLIDQNALANRALATWIRFNREALDFLKKLPASEFQVLKVDTLLESDRAVFETLTRNFGLEMEYVPASSLFDGKQFTAKPKSWSLEPGLMKQAEQVWAELEALLAAHHLHQQSLS